MSRARIHTECTQRLEAWAARNSSNNKISSSGMHAVKNEVYMLSVPCKGRLQHVIRHICFDENMGQVLPPGEILAMGFKCAASARLQNLPSEPWCTEQVSCCR